jgi:hypothetical protein
MRSLGERKPRSAIHIQHSINIKREQAEFLYITGPMFRILLLGAPCHFPRPSNRLGE